MGLVGDYGNMVQGVGVGNWTCQDCGNQGKKECPHRRCRTCCKSRGFDCATHVKSTWVPAARRRERQFMTPSKKPRLINCQTTATSHTSTSNTPPTSFDATSTHPDVGFKNGLPGQVRAPAVFKCVRVTAMDGGDDQFAYQAIVKIQGRVFKGFLYDQTIDVFPNTSELDLGGTNGTPSPILDPSSGGFLGGSGYGNPMN